MAEGNSWSPVVGWRERLSLRYHYPLLLDRLPETPREERGATRILDLPAGDGVLSIPLGAAGFSVVPCNLIPERLAATIERFGGGDVNETFRSCCDSPISPALAARLFAEEVPVVPGNLERVAGDIETRLPFADGEFDIRFLC